MTEKKRDLARDFLVRVKNADRPSGVVILMFSEDDPGIEALSEELCLAGYDVCICRVSHEELLISDAAIENVVESLYEHIREKYKYLPIFALGVKGGAAALMASGVELCGEVISSVPRFSGEGEKMIKKLGKFSLFKKLNKPYPALNSDFDRVFGKPFGKLPDDMSYAGVKILASYLSTSFGTLPPRSVPILVLSGKDDEYGKRYSETLSDNDHSLVECMEYDLAAEKLFSDRKVRENVISFFNESLKGYLESLSQMYGGTV